jgi:hypothetical protein
MTSRRRFLCTVSVSLLAASLAAEAQQAGKVYRIGAPILRSAPPSNIEVLRQALRDLGWIEGQKVDPQQAPEGYARALKIRGPVQILKAQALDDSCGPECVCADS